jgi:sulfatase maturation enzyme AslB (radical SAM superfamily)
VKPIRIPKHYNYIGAFITFACNLRCSYCINNFEQKGVKRKMISGKEWVDGINRIISRDDLPVTLQGGEPSMHPDFIYIINNIKPSLHIDILTNLQFDVKHFIACVDPQRLKRKAPYASIRVSFHPERMSIEELIDKTLAMQQANFSIGIWAVTHPAYEKVIRQAQKKCKKLKIDFREKQFLGEYQGKLHGTYRYPGACEKKFRKSVHCKTSEFLIDSAANIFRCHADLYAGINPQGNILDPSYALQDKFLACDNFGHCNPCDIKVKTNRFQQFGHTSVEVKFT